TATSASIRADRTSPSQGHAHRDRLAVARDDPEAVPLVERRAVPGGAEAQGVIALAPRLREQRLHQLVADSLAAAARDDGDRQLRRPLVDEPETRCTPRKEPVPGGADRLELVDRDETAVPLPPPALDVARGGQVGALVDPPEVGVAEHVAEEPDVLRTDRKSVV